MAGMSITRLSKPDAKFCLDDISTDPPKDAVKHEAVARLGELGKELLELQELMWGARTHSVLIILQGRDAAGKDGAIKNVVGALNPRGVNVTSFGVPTPEEREHDFLWRIHRRAPRAGEFAIFNRSHYEDVLVVRVHDLAPSPCGASATITSTTSRSYSPSTGPPSSSSSCTSARRSRRNGCSSGRRTRRRPGS